MHPLNPFAFSALRAVTAACAAALLLPLAGCVPLVLGGALAGTALSVADRRTAGSQFEDQAIELKCGQRLGNVIGDRGHLSCTSYNRVLLLTGELPTEELRTEVLAVAGRIEQVRHVVDDIRIGFNASLASRASDGVVSSRVKAALLDEPTVYATTIKVVTERGQVYLMGIVTEREAEVAAERARVVPGVVKVIKVFEVVSDPQARAASPATPPR